MPTKSKKNPKDAAKNLRKANAKVAVESPSKSYRKERGKMVRLSRTQKALRKQTNAPRKVKKAK